MARIPEEEIERLKERVPVGRLVAASGVELKKAGKDLLGRCPFHEDETASLVVTPGKNLWHCFGCGIGGGPIDWVMKGQAVSFRHAVELLRADLPSAAGVEGVSEGRRLRLPAPVALDAGEQELLDQVIGYYHETLLQSPEALAYLERRGIGDRELIERHRLGFANRTLGLRLPGAQVKAGAEVRGRLQKTGVLRESGHEHFNGCVVVPVFDEEGRVTEVYGRKITAGVNPPLHLYLPGPHRGVWNARGLAGQQEVILTEALIDAMTFWCAGYRNVTSAYGAEGLTDDHVTVLRSAGVKRVLIAYDRDEAGDRGSDKAAERLMAEGLACYRVLFPKGMDANGYALKVTPAAKSLALAIRKAVWLGKGPAPVSGSAGPGMQVEVVEQIDTALRDETPQIKLASSAAEPEPPADDAANDVPTEASSDEVVIAYGDRRYRVRGLAKNLSPQTLRINVMVSREQADSLAYHVDSLDLYAARARTAYITQAAKELGVTDDVIKLDLGRLLRRLEAVQAERIEAALKTEPARPVMTQSEQTEAMALLAAPDLLDRVVADLQACGLVGETTNKLAAYLAATSRRLDAPLAIVVQSTSAAGKSSLMDAVLAFMPTEDCVQVSALTGQSLYYMGQANLKNKILAIAEEEGASRAAYALKLLQSEGVLTIASTGKDAATGNLVTQQYRVEGPVMLFLTTTAIEIDEELLNRCLVLTVDEGREQTEAIHRLQRARRTLAGLKAKQDKARLIRLHRNVQRLLKPLAVVNPYADRLTFGSQKTRTRRDHEKYLTLIDTIALLHQYQRPVKAMRDGDETIAYIEVSLADIARANALAHEVLGRSLDELPPQTRRLLALIAGYVRQQMAAQAIGRADVRFTRRAIREVTGWGDTQLRVHLTRLLELEYLVAHRGMRGQSYEYELAFDGDTSADAPRLAGLIDAAELEASLAAPTTMTSSRGQGLRYAAPVRAESGVFAGAARVGEAGANPLLARLDEDEGASDTETAHRPLNGRAVSYGQVPSLAARAAS